MQGSLRHGHGATLVPAMCAPAGRFPGCRCDEPRCEHVGGRRPHPHLAGHPHPCAGGWARAGAPQETEFSSGIYSKSPCNFTSSHQSAFVMSCQHLVAEVGLSCRSKASHHSRIAVASLTWQAAFCLGCHNHIDKLKALYCLVAALLHSDPGAHP
jgi:hypothetical protein